MNYIKESRLGETEKKDPNEYYGCDVKKTIDNDGEILLMKDMPGNICPNCGSDYTEFFDTDQQDDFVFNYYSCHNCGCSWREDSKMIPKFITSVKWPKPMEESTKLIKENEDLSPVEQAAEVADEIGYSTYWFDRENETLLIYEGGHEIDIVDTENYEELISKLDQIKGLRYEIDDADTTCLAVWNRWN